MNRKGELQTSRISSNLGNLVIIPGSLKFLKYYVLGIAENLWPALDSSPSNSYTVNSCTILKRYITINTLAIFLFLILRIPAVQERLCHVYPELGYFVAGATPAGPAGPAGPAPSTLRDQSFCLGAQWPVGWFEDVLGRWIAFHIENMEATIGYYY